MEKFFVCSCNADDRFAPVSMYLMKNHLEEVKAGMKALAGDAKILYLLPENETVEGLEGEVKYAIKSPTLGNPYAVAQVLEGKLPRPMIADGYVAVYDGMEVNVVKPEAAYAKATGKEDCFVAVNKDGLEGKETEIKQVAAGTKLSDIVAASDAKAVLFGGLKGEFVKPRSLAECVIPEGTSSSSVTVFGKESCIVDTVKKIMAMSWEDSCGKCVLCREGTSQFKQITEEMTCGKAKQTDLDLINDVGELIEVGAYCPFGKNLPRPLLSAIALYQDDFMEHIKKKSCSAGVCYKAEAVYVILPDVCTGCGDCIDECDEDAIIGKSKFIHMIDQDMCEQCGKCVSACEESAIVAVEGKLPKLPKKLTKVGKF